MTSDRQFVLWNFDLCIYLYFLPAHATSTHTSTPQHMSCTHATPFRYLFKYFCNFFVIYQTNSSNDFIAYLLSEIWVCLTMFFLLLCLLFVDTHLLIISIADLFILKNHKCECCDFFLLVSVIYFYHNWIRSMYKWNIFCGDDWYKTKCTNLDHQRDASEIMLLCKS